MNIPDLTYVQANIHKMVPRVLKAHWPEFYEMLQTKYPNLRTSEQLYRYYNGNPEPCPCGKPTKYVNFSKGYAKYCSCKCAAKYNQSKREQTCKDKYGVTSVLSLEHIQRASKTDDILRRATQTRQRTCQIKYGVDNVSQLESVKESYKATCRQRYGVDNVFSSKQIQESIARTNINKYGCPNPGGLPSIQKRIKQSMNEKYGTDNISQTEWFRENCLERLQEVHSDVLRYEPDGEDVVWVCACPHPECQQCTEREYRIDRLTYYSRTHCTTGQRELCTILNPIGQHSKDTAIERFVRGILDEIGIEYETNVKLECGNVDIYIPDRKLIIECNGVRWHSDQFKKQHFHQHRQQDARRAGYELIYIWEDQIRNQPNNVRNLLRSKLNCFEHTIGARQCLIKELSTAEANTIIQYHLQGSCPASVKYGLLYKGQVVCVMTFGKRKISGGQPEWELIRFCCAPGWRVIGGAGKLLKYFIKVHRVARLVSFSSNDISNGNLYRTLGFEKVNETLSYWVVDAKGIRHHRYTYRKSELVKQGWDANLTEFEIENQMGAYRIWDAGQAKWLLTNEQHS